MAFVSEESIEKTWQRIGAFNGNEIRQLQKRHRKAQKPLTMFVYAGLKDVPEDAGGVLVYVYHVVLEAFLSVELRPKRVSKRQIESALNEYEPDSRFSLALARNSSPEPHVLDYVFEAFTEDDDEVVLSDRETESFLVILQVAIECLHRACQRK